VMNNITFTMSGGSITGNTVTKNGGGVMNNNNFTMSGGSISDNIANENGGGVTNNVNFTMFGGSITGNNANTKAGGVLTNNMNHPVIFGGTASITGNTSGSTTKKADNLYLCTDKTLTVGTKTGEAEADKGNGVPAPVAMNAANPSAPYMSIGVTTQTAPTKDNPVAITTANSTDYSGFFFADDSANVKVYNMCSIATGDDFLPLCKAFVLLIIP